MKRISLTIFTSLLIVVWLSPASAAANSPSAWAKDEIAAAHQAGVLTSEADADSYQAAVTRLEFCKTLIRAYEVITGDTDLAEPTEPFTDTSDASAVKAYALGIIQGYPDGTFQPESRIKREEITKMLYSTAVAIRNCASRQGEFIDGWLLNTLENVTEYWQWQLTQAFYDADSISDWARASAIYTSYTGLMQGSDNRLNPQKNCTREEAFLVIMRMVWRYNAEGLLSLGLQLPAPKLGGVLAEYYRDYVSFYWLDYSAAAKSYMVTLSDSSGVVLYSQENQWNSFNLSEWSEPEIDDVFGALRGRQDIYVSVSAIDSSGVASTNTLQFSFALSEFYNPNERFFGDRDKYGFSSEAEAKSYMQTISVKIWRLQSDGSKKPGTASLVVNKGVADEVVAIFDKIYDGPEKFPIKDVGGFRWGSGTSSHSHGFAIDINSNENYFISRDGVVSAGSLWEPGVNPYSISPDGDVVAAFSKYDWFWGGYGWSNGFDYMHFSWDGR